MVRDPTEWVPELDEGRVSADGAETVEEHTVPAAAVSA